MLITDFHLLYKQQGLSEEVIKTFQLIIYSYFKKYGRKFPFRTQISPYNVLVSELMLQQTQASRVSEKFLEFIQYFPDFESLSKAPLDEVLKIWQGLGYNRRAIALKDIAMKIVEEFDGQLPNSVEILKTFPQIGHNTASSIVAFAFNTPSFFIETNIRRVYIYYFFPKKNLISDKEIMPVLEESMDNENPRKWYYALMDYGVMLKKTHPGLNKRSAHYRKQSNFKGSTREIRGNILKLLLSGKKLTEHELSSILNCSPKLMSNIINSLLMEGFIEREGHHLRLKK